MKISHLLGGCLATGAAWAVSCCPTVLNTRQSNKQQENWMQRKVWFEKERNSKIIKSRHIKVDRNENISPRFRSFPILNCYLRLEVGGIWMWMAYYYEQVEQRHVQWWQLQDWTWMQQKNWFEPCWNWIKKCKSMFSDRDQRKSYCRSCCDVWRNENQLKKAET